MSVDPNARDEQFTVSEQLSRIVFYGGLKAAADSFRQIDWATDQEKTYAIATFRAMTSNDRIGWAAL